MTTAPVTPATTRQASVDAALLVLKSMGLSPQDLLAPSNRPSVPTFAEYVPVVSATVTAASLRAYRPYWNRIVVRQPPLPSSVGSGAPGGPIVQLNIGLPSMRY
jgi:hypothetical protein